ncbi:MAG: type II toxin-antitoxin system VapC family toxin [bacterium]
MKDDIVLDTSVVVKWFQKKEKQFKEAARLKDAFLKGKSRLTIPPLVLYEVGNVLRFKEDLSAEDVNFALKALLEMGLNFAFPDEDVLAKTTNFAFEYKLTFYDAHFVALADDLGHDFVTADKKLFEKTKKLPFVLLLDQI